MIVMNNDGELFDERRKKDRRKNTKTVSNEKRKDDSDRRKVNINEVKKHK